MRVAVEPPSAGWLAALWLRSSFCFWYRASPATLAASEEYCSAGTLSVVAWVWWSRASCADMTAVPLETYTLGSGLATYQVRAFERDPAVRCGGDGA